jgi:hypothetical protein
MLAGKMKLNHFLAIAAFVGVAGSVGAYFACRSGDDDGKTMKSTKADVDRERAEQRERAERLSTRHSNTTPDEPRPLADTPPTPTPTDDTKPIDDEPRPANDNLRDVDRELMSWVGKDLGSKKKKDARKGNAWKINLYQDDGNSTMNRAKVDLDRDDKWDEKWTFDGKNISRKVSPNDDEDYADEYDWDGSTWMKR